MDETSRTAAFENVKDQIGACGIWCGSCVVGNGALTELTARYRGIIDGYGIDEWGPGEYDHASFMKGLDAIQAMTPCPGCRKGGGRDHCELRACAQRHGLNECAECDSMATCEHAELLEHMRAGALAAGLMIKGERGNAQTFIDRSAAELRGLWPCCLLFGRAD